MGKRRWALVVWPGLGRLWDEGSWSAVAWAAGFGAILNSAVIATWVWTGLIRYEVRTGLWALATIGWLAGAAYSAHRLRRRASRHDDDDRDPLYAEAIRQYLQQNWFQAERSLEELIQRRPDDLESRLMLASICRRTGRIDEAKTRLKRIRQIEGHERWRHELDSELGHLNRLAESPAQSDEAAIPEQPDPASAEPSLRAA